jgi:type I restriction enzyme M protein
MSAEDDYLTLTEVASLAEVRLSAVSNWRIRHPDFPQARTVSGREVFELRETARWLGGRKVPRHRLVTDERPGVTYGDRLMRNLEASGEAPVDSTRAEPSPGGSDWVAQLWNARNRLRGMHGTASSLEVMLGLVYLKACRADVWRSLVGAPDWTHVGRLLAEADLPAAVDGLSLPVFGTVARTADSTLVEAITVIDEIDFGQTTTRPAAGQAAEAILQDLERDMGRSGGHFTPPDLAQCLVELLDPQAVDRIYDPFCGSGELLAAAAAHVRRGHGVPKGWRVYGQAPYDWSWRTSAMNLALHGVECALGGPGDALQGDTFSDQRFSLILANPPFNVTLELPQGRVWPYGDPAPRNGNFAWLQYVVSKLEPGGRAAVVMPANAAFSRGHHDALVRGNMVSSGAVECVIALPSSLFRFTNISTMIWILRGIGTTPVLSETLLMDAQDLGETVDRTKRRLGAHDIERIVGEYGRWRAADAVDGGDGFSLAVSHDELAKNGYVLLPQHYAQTSAEKSKSTEAASRLDALKKQIEDLRERVRVSQATLDTRLPAFGTGDPPRDGGQRVPLGSVCDVLAGPGTVARSGDDGSGTPLVLPRNIRNDRVGPGNLDTVPPAVEARLVRYRLISGDTVSARTGTLGRFGLVLDDQTGWLVGPGCVRFRPAEGVVPAYLTYYLSSPAAQQWLRTHAVSSPIPHVNTATLREMPLWLPPPDVQRAIVETLDPFNATASLHRELNAATEELRSLVIQSLIPPS